jgi:hypothetical protein
MKIITEQQLQKRTNKLIQLLDEMSALLPPKIGAVCALRDIYEGINKLSIAMLDYHSDELNKHPRP